jgi:Family of unknown function (DUF695)
MPMTNITLTLPQPRSVVLAFVQDDLPGVATINSALSTFADKAEHKAVFRWHLSVLVEADGLSPRELPEPPEQGAILDVQAQLAALVEADGQALWLARNVHNGAWEVLWRVHDARQVQSQLNALIDSGTHLRPFSYKLQDDPTWALAQEYLDQAAAVQGA